MYKRYLAIIIVLATLVGCFFLFFDKPSNKDLYTRYLQKLESVDEYDSLSENKEINLVVDSKYIDVDNQYHYVITITSNENLSNFKTMAISDFKNTYYPSFGIFDNKNINLVNSENPASNETRGVNLVVSNREEIESFKIYVSYNNKEYFYLVNSK